MNNAHRGFASLAALILLGLTVIAGGTATAIYLQKEHAAPEEALGDVQETQAATSTETGDTTPVSQDLEVSRALDTDTEVDADQDVSKPQTANVAAELQVSADTLQICESAAEIRVEGLANSDSELEENITHARNSLIGNIRTTCEDLIAGNFSDAEDLKRLETNVAEKWQLWEVTQQNQSRDVQDEMDNISQEVSELYAERDRALERLNDQENADDENAEAETYTRSDTYPVILSFTDNHGNTYKRSSHNGYEGPYGIKQKIELNVGDTIRATVEAEDPDGRKLEYNWHSNSQPFNDEIGIIGGKYHYSSDNTLEYTLTEEDLKSVGDTFRLVYQVRVVNTDFYRGGSGNTTDDTGFIDYQLSP